MKTFIFQKIHYCSTKKLWDRGGESRKRRGRKTGWSNPKWMKQVPKDKNSPIISVAEKLLQSIPLRHLKITDFLRDPLAMWSARWNKTGKQKTAISLSFIHKLIWRVSLIMPTSVCPSKSSRGTLRTSQTIVGENANEWRVHRTDNKSPTGGIIIAAWKFKPKKWNSAAETSSSAWITWRSFNETREKNKNPKEEMNCFSTRRWPKPWARNWREELSTNEQSPSSMEDGSRNPDGSYVN